MEIAKKIFIIILLLLLCNDIYAVNRLKFQFEFGNIGNKIGYFEFKEDIQNLIKFDRDNAIYILDDGNSRVQKFSKEGLFLGIFGEYGIEDGRLNKPYLLALDNKKNIYIVDIKEYYLDEKIKNTAATLNRIQIFDENGNFVKLCIFPKGEKEGEIYSVINDLVVDEDGNFYILETQKHRIQKFDNNGNFLFAIGRYGNKRGELSHPASLVLDDKKNIYILDSGNYRIQKFNSDGKFLFSFSKRGKERGDIFSTGKIFIDKDNKLYLTQNSGKIWIYKNDKYFDCIIFDDTIYNYTDKFGFEKRTGIFVDYSGCVFISGFLDEKNFKIKKFSQTKKLQWRDFSREIILHYKDSAMNTDYSTKNTVSQRDYDEKEFNQKISLSYPYNERTKLSIWQNFIISRGENIDIGDPYNLNFIYPYQKKKMTIFENIIGTSLAWTKYISYYKNLLFTVSYYANKKNITEAFATTHNTSDYKPRHTQHIFDIELRYNLKKSYLKINYDTSYYPYSYSNFYGDVTRQRQKSDNFEIYYYLKW